MAQADPKDKERISMYYRLVIPEGDETESIVEEFRRAFVSHIKDVDGLPDNEILFEKN